MADDKERNLATVADDLPFATLKAAAAFEKLTQKEKLYAYHLAMASWAGYFVVNEQISPEAPGLIKFFLSLNLTKNNLATLQKIVVEGKVASEREFQQFVEYIAYVFSNAGNYKAFGDTKFLPRVSKESFQAIVDAATPKAYTVPPGIDIPQLIDAIYSFEPSERMLGWSGAGVTTYYSPGFTQDEAEFIQKFLTQNKLEAYNTRVFKEGETYIVRLASVEAKTVSESTFEGKSIKIVGGDYANHMAQIVKHMEAAVPYAANENQKKMVELYAVTFANGDINVHKDSQRAWVKDQGPVVETNIGFIESYRDPLGVRGEWEGFVACVDKALSETYGKLVKRAEEFIAKVPWPKEYEKDTFLKPDYTALDVVAFCCSGVPAGINIPNYDDIRQTEGFKNVSLTNVVSATTPKTAFLLEADDQLLQDLKGKEFGVHVALHELLGHGCGKLLTVDENGKKNFDEDLINPITNEKVASWYAPGETWSSVFGGLASSLEECRAECAGLFLCSERPILEIFGHESAEQQDNVVYANYLRFAHYGLTSLEFYNPGQKKWGQAHMQGRFAIFRVLLQSGAVQLHWNREDKESKPHVTVDRARMETDARAAVADLFRKLNIYKATRDLKRATEMWDELTTPDEYWLELRAVALKYKLWRSSLVQPLLTLDGEDVKIEEGEGTAAGQIDTHTRLLKPLLWAAESA